MNGIFMHDMHFYIHKRGCAGCGRSRGLLTLPRSSTFMADTPDFGMEEPSCRQMSHNLRFQRFVPRFTAFMVEIWNIGRNETGVIETESARTILETKVLECYTEATFEVRLDFIAGEAPA